MTSDIRSEIARRLDVAPADIAPVLETAVGRIRQQVEHYGYARLSGLGTFRRRDEGLVFEPDPALDETINARFTGLDELVLEPADPDSAVGATLPTADDEDQANPWEGIEAPDDAESPFDYSGEAERGAAPPPYEGTDIPEAGADEPLYEGTDVPEAETDKSLEEGTAIPEGAAYEALDAGTDVPEGEADRPLDEGAPVPEGEVQDPSAEGVRRPASEDLETEDDDIEEESGTFWDGIEGPAEKHPLGPESEPPYEEADFSVLGEPEDEAEETDVSTESPTVSWAPMGSGEKGSASRDRDSSGRPSAAKDADDERAAVAGEESAEQDEAGAAHDVEHDAHRATSDRPEAPDRTAVPHGLREGGPVRTIHPPSRRSKKRRDPKPIWFGVGIIVLVAAAAVAYFMLPDRPQAPMVEETTQAEAPPPPDTSAVAAGDTAAVEEAETPPPPPATPLRSDEGIDPADGGYTLVVFSDTDESVAEEQAANYRDQGFRSSVLSSQQDGVTRYRVGVGQFATLEEAADQLNELAGGDLPADAWVLGL